MKKHLAIMHQSAIEAILSGRKTIETRFSLYRIVPYGVISVGDLVYLKPPGKEIVGEFKAKKVFSYEGLSPEDIRKIFQNFADKIRVGNKVEDGYYRQQKMASRYATLIFIGESKRFIAAPVKIKKSDRRGWIVLDKL